MTVTQVAPQPRLAPAVPSRRPSAAGRRHRRKGALAAYAFVLPGFGLYALVMLYPAVQTFLLSLRQWNIVPGA